MNLSVNAEISVSRNKNKKKNPNPIIALSWKDVYQDCPEHEDCFDYAIEKNWHFWSCAECPLYKKTTQTPPIASPKSPKPAENKPTTTPPISPKPKAGLWRRFTSMLGGGEKKPRHPGPRQASR